MGYDGDSFFTLTATEGLGLLTLSGALWALCLLLAWRAARLWVALLLFWAFVWLSPQIYYLYYQVIFDGLPWQIVVKSPPGIANIARLLTFQDEASLSRHGQGVLGWTVILVAILRIWRKRSAERTPP